MMLEMTLKTDFKPGANRKDDMVTADWRFLLPELQLKRVVCVGNPPISTVRVLANMGAEVVVLSGRTRKLADLEKELSGEHLAPRVRTLLMNGKFPAEMPQERVDLLLFQDPRSLRQFISQPKQWDYLLRLLRPETGSIFFRVQTPLHAGLYRKAQKQLAAHGFTEIHPFRLAPALGYMRAAVALDDGFTSRFFIDHLVYSNSLKNRILKAISGLLGSYPRAVIARRKSGSDQPYLPDFIKEIAAAGGMDLAGYPWGLAAGGKHNAKKILYFFFDPDSRETAVITKVTRDPSFNYRLENEYQVLKYLAEHQLAAPGTVPRVLFFGYHNELAVLGQQAIPGKSFRSQTQASAECPLMHKAITWITDLGVASHTQPRADSREIQQVLSILFEKFVNIYDIASAQKQYLSEKIHQFAEISRELPLVFQHGDPGSWNMLVTEEQQVAVIDWEAGEPRGMPLWDLFYFIKTYGTLVARKIHGSIDSTEAFKKNFLSKTAIGDVLIDATRRYCQKINLDTRQVETLFLTCWMHRSLKEAMRLPKKEVNQGHYVNTLRIAIDHRNAGALGNLFSLEMKP